VNSVTNKIYVGNGTYLTVIDGVTNGTTAVPVGSGSGPIAVNPVTNKIYVGSGNNVIVVDGATNVTTAVPVGTDPVAIAVNTVTNKVYVANYNQGGSGSVTVIDGATDTTTAVPVGSQPGAIAVNPVTNLIYVANYGAYGSSSGSGVTVIDGATNETSTVAAGSEPVAVAVNPLTNQIYVANFASSTVTVINGVTNANTTLSVGPGPDAIAVNTATNTVYTANTGGNTGTVTVINGATAASSASPARIVNVSARAQVGTAGNVLISGFVIAGGGTETLLIRGDGPSLAQFGVSGFLASPSLSVFDGAGNVVASNTGWGTNANAAQIAGVAAQVGAFALAAGSADCAVEVSLPAGAYTVQISGASNAVGLALAEVYEVSSSGTRLINISSRAQVGAGGNIIILGFVITGTGTEVMLMRADGPALTQFGVAAVLAQPSLNVFDGVGNTVASNTGWGHSFDEDLIAGFAAAVGAFPLPPGSPDSAQFVNLSPGAYTMQVSGANDTTGVALAEAYEEQ
jgi:YVTN family beta-propeller protein